MLARPRKIVAVEDADVAAVRAAHLPGPHIGMPDRHLDRMKRQPEQLLRAIERRLDHAVELEVRLDLGLLEVAAPGAKLLGVVAPVPWRDLEIAALLRDQLLQGVAVGERGLARRRPD